MEFDFTISQGNFKAHYQGRYNSDFTGIYGPSGCGKSTLLEVLAGFKNPDTGFVSGPNNKLFYAHHKHLPSHKRRTAYLSQSIDLFPHLSLAKNILYSPFAPTLNTALFKQIIEPLGLEPLLNQMPSQLSGGQKQRGALARALLSQPQLLLLDEAFSAQDQKQKQAMIDLVIHLQKKQGFQSVIVSHSLPEILSFNPQISLIENGSILKTDSYSNLLQNPLSRRKLYTNHTLNQWNGFYIQSNEISLSLKPVPQCTIQHQIAGEIISIFEENNKILCQVQTGSTLFAEITKQSQERLQLHPGKSIYCLFKESSLLK